MKSENILMDEIVKIRRELKRIKKEKKKKRNLRKRKHRISTKYLTNPVQPSPQPIMITMPPQQQPLENLRDMGRNYLIPGNNLINQANQNQGNQLAIIPPAINQRQRLPPLLPSAKKKKKRITRAFQYEKPQLKKQSIKELRELIKLRLPGKYTEADLKRITGKNKDQAIDYFLQQIGQDERGRREDDDDDDDQYGAMVTDYPQYGLAPDHPQFGRSHNDDHFGLDGSQLLHSNSKFGDGNYDEKYDDAFSGASLIRTPIAKGQKDAISSKEFTHPRQVPPFKDQSAKSTSFSMRLPISGFNDFDDDDDDMTPGGRGLTDMFYSPDKGLGIGLSPSAKKKLSKSKEDRREDKQILKAVIAEEKKQANRSRRSSGIPVTNPAIPDGGAVRVVTSKVRGRPVGSKNKPKDP